MIVTIIGCGNMGLAYAKSFVKYAIVKPGQLFLLEKNPDKQTDLRKDGFQNICSLEEYETQVSDVFLIAVKPQDFFQIGPLLAEKIPPKSVVLSIMAGITIDTLSTILKTKRIIRAMPNMAARMGMGMTAWCSGTFQEPAPLRQVENLLNSTGKCIHLDDEDLLNPVTALSGSGPAYFFFFFKQMVEAGIRLGFDESTAQNLVRQTMLGAFHLLNQAEQTPDQLIQSIASKGGTTEAALNIFNRNEVDKAIQNAIIAASQRAKELELRP